MDLAQQQGRVRRRPDRPTSCDLARVIDYIEAEIDQDLRLPALADVGAMSLYDFARRFRQSLGVSPHAYVLSRRVARARAMLVERDRTLADVALACGFSSQSHLTTAFRRSLGVTPGVYRHQMIPSAETCLANRRTLVAQSRDEAEDERDARFDRGVAGAGGVERAGLFAAGRAWTGQGSDQPQPRSGDHRLGARSAAAL